MDRVVAGWPRVTGQPGIAGADQTLHLVELRVVRDRAGTAALCPPIECDPTGLHILVGVDAMAGCDDQVGCDQSCRAARKPHRRAAVFVPRASVSPKLVDMNVHASAAGGV